MKSTERCSRMNSKRYIMQRGEDNMDTGHEKHAKSCEICGETFMGCEWETTCFKHKYKKMYPDREASDEFVYG